MPGGSEEKLPFGQGTPAWLDYFASVTGCKALVEEYLKLTRNFRTLAYSIALCSDDYSSVRELYDPYDAKAVERMLLEMVELTDLWYDSLLSILLFSSFKSSEISTGKLPP